jgi:uncharacterized repeat protein (TIGR03803 family)
VLHSFAGSDGSAPIGPVIQATNGLLYGTAQQGGATIDGAAFSLSLTGVFTPFYNFGRYGDAPAGGFVQATNGNLYAATQDGGGVDGGMLVEITPAGTLVSAHSFTPDIGVAPTGTLIQATDGNFYGTTARDGGDQQGSLFELTSDGGFVKLHTFSGNDGGAPAGGLVQATDGNFYGTALTGGSHGYGTVFRLSMGLAPFVKTVPWFGKIGTPVTILGTNLTGASSVTFNGAPSEFTVLSPTAIITHVPIGATSGTLQVVTPGGTLSSNIAFELLP